MGQYHHYSNTLTASEVDPVVLVASGPTCLQHIIVGRDVAAGVAPVIYHVKDADGTVLHKFQADQSQERTVRDGQYCGPWGIHSDNGLTIDVEDADGGGGAVLATFVYGFGRGEEIVPVSKTSMGYSTHEILPAGQNGTLVGFNIWGTAVDTTFEAKTKDGDTIAKWWGDSTGEATQRNSFYCGPWGIDFHNGLDFVTVDRGGLGGNLFFSVQVDRRF